jgi:hypothetical protein
MQPSSWHGTFRFATHALIYWEGTGAHRSFSVMSLARPNNA